MTKRHASYLTPHDMHRLDWACHPIYVALGTPFLVGSVLNRPDYRDIDVRLVLPDDHPLCQLDTKARLLLNVALTDLVAKAANMPAPLDFQVQSRTEMEPYLDEVRNPLGTRFAFRSESAVDEG